jgi:glycosyltransferase involved in cell wall biosynthesis
LALVKSPEHVCCRYRLAALRPCLERAGHTLELQAWPRHWWTWAALAPRLRYRDGVIIQRKPAARWQLQLLRLNSRFLLYDFDDSVFGRDSYAAKGIQSGRRWHRFRRLCRAADGVIAGNPFLANQARCCTTNDRVHLVPTCVNPSLYHLAAHTEPAGNSKLVWIGSASTLQGLESIRPILERLGQQFPALRLKLICDRFMELNHMPVELVKWTQASEARELASADIGISWMPDDDWSRGKCGLKVLQYMAAGLPVVANPVGIHRDMVRHGETGFLAESEADWRQAIGRLIADPQLRRRMGLAGRQRVEQEFSLDIAAGRWLELLQRLQEGSAAA